MKCFITEAARRASGSTDYFEFQKGVYQGCLLYTSARKGINPLTKAPIEIAACTVPAFKAGKAFKDAVK